MDIWKNEKFRKLQGSYPVIFLSFAGVKQTTYEKTRSLINELIVKLFIQYEWILKEKCFTHKDREFYEQVSRDMDDTIAALSLNTLYEWLYRYYGKKCIVLLDKYATAFGFTEDEVFAAMDEQGDTCGKYPQIWVCF